MFKLFILFFEIFHFLLFYSKVFSLFAVFTAREIGKQCPQMCSREFNVRCATITLADGTVDQKTFSNPCALRVHNCLHDTSKNSFSYLK